MYMLHIIGKLLTWRLQMVNISLIGHAGETTPSQTLDLKHVETIKFSDKRTCGISLESS